MEVEYTSHNLSDKVSNNEIVVTLTNVRNGVTLHWCWNRKSMNHQALLEALSEDGSIVTESIKAYIELSKDQKAREICSALVAIDGMSGEAEETAIQNMGSMLIMPYILDSKAWQMMQYEATADHNTISLLVDYDAAGYVLRPMATAHYETYSDALDKGIAQAMQMAYQTGWLKQVDGQWTLRNNEGLSIEGIKLQRSGTNMTPKKKKRKK